MPAPCRFSCLLGDTTLGRGGERPCSDFRTFTGQWLPEQCSIAVFHRDGNHDNDPYVRGDARGNFLLRDPLGPRLLPILVTGTSARCTTWCS